MEKIFTIGFREFDYFTADVINDEELITLHLTPYDDLDDESTKERIKDAIKFDMEFNDSYDSDNYSELSNKICKEMLQKEDILEGIEYIYFDAELEDVKIFLDSNPKLKDYKVTVFVDNKYDHDEAREIKETLDYDNIYVKLPFVNGSFASVKPIKLERYMLNSFLFNKMCFDIEKMNLSPLESLIYAYQMINIKELECDKKTELGDEVVNKSLSLHSINELFDSFLDKLDFRHRIISGNLNNNYINTLYFAVYIKDKKYNVDGIYYFSPLLEKFYNGGKVNNSFKYFGKNVSSLNENKPYYKVEVERIIDNNLLDKFINKYKNASEISGMDEDLYLNINYASNLINGQSLLNKLCTIKDPQTLEMLSLVNEKVDAKEVVSTVESFKNKVDNEIDDFKFICLMDSVLDACDRKSGTTTNLLTLVDIVDSSDRTFDYDIRLKRTIDFEKRITREINQFFGIEEDEDFEDDEA